MTSAAQPQGRIVDPAAVRDAPLHVVLVEPQIPPNTGNVARLCAATGCALHLVEPLGFRIDDRELKRAGLDYWDALAVVVHPSLDDFFATIPPQRCWFASTRAAASYRGRAYARGDALVLGAETTGLPAALLERYPDRAIRIPMRAGLVRSINLATSAGIVTYEALATIGFPGLV